MATKRTKILWGMFEIWAKDNDINLDNKDDWEPWWLCYVAGYDKCLELHEIKENV
jgi:hypothetical protein